MRHSPQEKLQTMEDDWQVALIWTLLPAGRAWQKAAGAAFAELGVSLAVAAPVLVIARLGNGVRQKAVSEAAGIDPAALVRSLDQLETSGILRRADDPHDRRAKTLHLTDKGAQLAADLQRMLEQVKRRIFSRFSDADGATTVRVLAEIMRAANEETGEG